jgi:predicted phosphodiesterase
MPDLDRLARRLAPVATAVLVATAGAAVALLAAGRASYRLGPFDVELHARPGAGLTEVALPPLGEIRADTHAAPLRLTATLDQVDPDEANRIVSERGLDGLVEVVERRGRDAVEAYALRAALVALVGTAAAALVVHRNRWNLLGATLVAGLAVVGVTGGATVAGYRPEAFIEPAYTGSLRLAPDLIGPIRSAGRRIEVFRTELGRLVRGTVEAYGAVTAGPGPSEEATVVLHISDIHSSPLGMDFAQQLGATFDADLVLDTGDLTSFGSRVERAIIERIPEFGVPYLLVRGNHDSIDIGGQVQALAAAETLEAEAVDAAGLRVFGAAHPLFTPDRPYGDDEVREAVAAAGRDLAERVATLSESPDIVLVHDGRMAEELAGDVPLVLSGHFHRFAARVLDGTIYLETASAGGGGLDTFIEDQPPALAAEVLYLEGTPLRLVAVDRVALDPRTRQLTVERRLAESIREEAGEPVVAPSSVSPRAAPPP